MSYLFLQNGSDIRGVALDGVPDQPITLDETTCQNIAVAFALWLGEKQNKKPNELRISIGRDSRLSGPTLADWISHAMAQQGVDVYDCGLASTPAMFMSTITPDYEFDGAIMITASHLPFNRNGFKFFTKEGGLEKKDITVILELAGSFTSLSYQGEVGAIHFIDFIQVYSNILVQTIRTQVNNGDQPLAGFHIIVDAGNGAGGFFVEQVLNPLGATTQGSQFLDPDGLFPNHIPNPEDETAMASIRSAVIQQQADLGIIFDTDVDRAGAVDEIGQEINRNRLIALISAILLEEFPGTTIVTDSITSTGLKTFIEEKGGIHHRFKRGYKNVINEAKRLNHQGQDTQLAIETSGHGAMKENYFLDDGAYLITKLLIKMAQLRNESKTLSSLIATLQEPKESFEFRLPILVQDFTSFGNQLLNDLAAYAVEQHWQVEPNNFEGIRVNFDAFHDNGWFLLRLSLHDPLMPLNIESEQIGGSNMIAQALIPFFAHYSEIDYSTLIQFITN